MPTLQYVYTNNSIVKYNVKEESVINYKINIKCCIDFCNIL